MIEYNQLKVGDIIQVIHKIEKDDGLRFRYFGQYKNFIEFIRGSKWEIKEKIEWGDGELWINATNVYKPDISVKLSAAEYTRYFNRE